MKLLISVSNKVATTIANSGRSDDGSFEELSDTLGKIQDYCKERFPDKSSPKYESLWKQFEEKTFAKTFAEATESVLNKFIAWSNLWLTASTMQIVMLKADAEDQKVSDEAEIKGRVGRLERDVKGKHLVERDVEMNNLSRELADRIIVQLDMLMKDLTVDVSDDLSQPWMLSTFHVHYDGNKEIGSGASGIVYEGFYSSKGFPSNDTGKRVAVKVFHPTVMHRLINEEATAWRSVSHLPTVALFHGVCTVGNQLLVSELCRGSMLKYLEDNPGNTYNVLFQIAEGLRSMHDLNVVHSDLKPDNILIRHDGSVSITDFGASRLQGTSTNTPGSKNYAPPIIDPNQPIQRTSKADDIWGFGMTAYHTITNMIPYQPLSGHSLSLAIQNKMLPEFPKDVIDQHSELVELIRKCWEYYPYARPSARDLVVHFLKNARSKEAAVNWYQERSAEGHTSAQVLLGVMYENGYGVEKDYSKTYAWYLTASYQGSAGGQDGLGDLYFEGRGVEKYYKEAVKWYTLSANQGNANGQYGLGCMYYYGIGLDKNEKEAVKWYTQSANQGNADGQYSLGILYAYGFDKNEKEAVKWYTLSANQGHSSACYRLGEMFRDGNGCEKDREKARFYFSKAGEDHKEAVNDLKSLDFW
ncbi:UNVERIFIED_CONTAM: hypothetical protein HDU68_012715 [Siphonaria sp. JEL0065]|nr:hypothetical protein HDU68_012715 [Siphonaria sp. JEL0065]